jgi:hypothetical protein
MIHTHTQGKEQSKGNTHKRSLDRAMIYIIVYIYYTPGDRIQRYIIYLNFC